MQGATLCSCCHSSSSCKGSHDLCRQGSALDFAACCVEYLITAVLWVRVHGGEIPMSGLEANASKSRSPGGKYQKQRLVKHWGSTILKRPLQLP